MFRVPGPVLSKNLQQTSWEQQLSGNVCTLDHKSKNGDGNNPASLEGKPSSNKVVPALSSGLHSWGRRKQIYTLQMTIFPHMHRPWAQVTWPACCIKLWHSPHWACSDWALLFFTKKEEQKKTTLQPFYGTATSYSQWCL